MRDWKRCGGNSCGRPGGWVGWAAVIVGAIILMALILPRWFWWIVCAGALIWGGVCLLKKH